MRTIMTRFLFAVLAATALASSTGCCRIERLACYGLFDGGCFGPSYGHEGPYGGSGYSCGQCANCAEVGKRSYGGAGATANQALYDNELPPAEVVVPQEAGDLLPWRAPSE
jgi:hypothetical protein